MLAGLLGLFASIFGLSCSLAPKQAVVRNETDDFVLVHVERVDCTKSRPLLYNNWSVVGRGDSIRLSSLGFGASCLVVTNPERTSFQTSSFSDDAVYRVSESRGRLAISQSEGGSGSTSSFASRDDPSDRTSRSAALVEKQDASPKLLWVIGLPAILSGIYGVYVAGSFAWSMISGGPRTPT